MHGLLAQRMLPQHLGLLATRVRRLQLLLDLLLTARVNLSEQGQLAQTQLYHEPQGKCQLHSQLVVVEPRQGLDAGSNGALLEPSEQCLQLPVETEAVQKLVYGQLAVLLVLGGKANCYLHGAQILQHEIFRRIMVNVRVMVQLLAEVNPLSGADLVDKRLVLHLVQEEVAHAGGEVVEGHAAGHEAGRRRARQVLAYDTSEHA